MELVCIISQMNAYFITVQIYPTSPRWPIQAGYACIWWAERLQERASCFMQIWYLKYLLPETQEGRADQCADNNELSGLSVQTTNTGENLVIQMTHSVAWTFFFVFFFVLTNTFCLGSLAKWSWLCHMPLLTWTKLPI